MHPSPPPSISPFLYESYTPEQVEKLYAALRKRKVFDFHRFSTGLFPAVGPGARTDDTSGYLSAWVRDNVHIAYAHYVCGAQSIAVENALCLASYFSTHRRRFTDIIEKKRDPAIPMNRPHIRFNGETCEEIDEKWPHAQNDAMGYFLWFFCMLLKDRTVEMTEAWQQLLADIVYYVETIEYWQDEDSGHWEEQRKLAASSIGAIVAGLTQYRELLDLERLITKTAVAKSEVEALISQGTAALNRILPWECIQSDPSKQRRYDAALLFLADPLAIVSEEMTDTILTDVAGNLQGAFGISRYPKDSYWGPDYRQLPEDKRTIDLSDHMSQRDAFAVPGEEAEWCIFDTIVSLIHGKKYRRGKDPRDLANQVTYLNRGLRQLVELDTAPGRFFLPEAYFIEKGRYVPNDHLPLQWAHANLWRAVVALIKNIPLPP